MSLPRFALEDWVAAHKKSCRYSMGSSDVEPVTIGELFDGADAQTRRLWSETTLSYGDSRGSALLREHVAALYDTLGADDVHTFNGATEAVFALINVLVEPGSEVVVVGPTYQLLTDLPAAAGATVRRVDLRAEDGWTLDMDALAAAVTDRTAVVVINFPNNPTGATLTPARFDDVVELTRRADARLVSDEVYRGLDPAGVPLPAAADRGPHCISIGSVSKVYGLPGARIGWVASSDRDLLDRLRTYRYWTSLGNNAAGEVFAVCGLRRSRALLGRARNLVTANAARLAEFVAARSEHLAHTPARAGTVAMVELRHHGATALATRMAREHSVWAVPSGVLHLPDTHLRVGLGRATLDRTLEALDECLSEP
ncbi:aspartate/methionine/tyrosine aminotransferase [Pseudonocardia sediminis]|uniref:Aminotransferase n=1 Tax=Pseudonocardia sediminis TaxID=1397368 RepID=A0A4Q7UV78_PSEST|nr:aminotransferase class I/II-fold pyridoxal phosphate-dependent enzyme [Pseudonocardia sediminis]RZT85696.1 aspartate/methionine/tyrosine aminotransferase [Pseudonocardia sediminis]